MKNKQKTLNIVQKILFAIVLILSFSFLLNSCGNNDPIEKTYILIYNGTTADADGVIKVAQMAEEQGYEVKYISNLSQLPDMLEGAYAFIIGGTEDDTESLLNELLEVKDDLKTYIENGGNYLGICGGAYMASKGCQWEDGYEAYLSLVDCESFAYDSQYTDPQIITIEYESQQRTVYYQYGPAFLESELPANSTVLAYYTNENKDVAAFYTSLGDGKILLCGPHPEADNTWLIDDPEPLNADQWTATWDIFTEFFNLLLED